MLDFSQWWCSVSVGFRTRTAIAASPLARCLPLARKGGEHLDALAGDPHSVFMAGGGCYVQRETLKAFGLSRGRF